MTELMLQKITLVIFLSGWLCSSVYFYFRGDWSVRREVIMSIMFGFMSTLVTMIMASFAIFCVLFLMS